MHGIHINNMYDALFRLLVSDVQTLVVDYLYVRYIVCVVRNEFKELTRFDHKLFRAHIWVLCKLSPYVVQTEYPMATAFCNSTETHVPVRQRSLRV